MGNYNSAKVKTIGIVGAGRGGMAVFNLFAHSQLIRIAFVEDINPTAPTLALARQAGIRTYNNLDEALADPVDLIVEATGSAEVTQTIAARINGKGSNLVTHAIASLFSRVIGEKDQSRNREVVCEITEIKGEITESLTGIHDLVDQIEDITAQMNILAINARIEAARAGEHGKSFGIVANEIRNSAEKVKEIVQQIQKVNGVILHASAKIDDSLNRLN